MGTYVNKKRRKKDDKTNPPAKKMWKKQNPKPTPKKKIGYIELRGENGAIYHPYRKKKLYNDWFNDLSKKEMKK